MHALPFADAHFDLVVLMHALTYADQPAQAVAEAARVLRPGGRLLLTSLARHEHRGAVEAFGHVNLGFSREGTAEVRGQGRAGHRQLRDRDPRAPPAAFRSDRPDRAQAGSKPQAGAHATRRRARPAKKELT